MVTCSRVVKDPLVCFRCHIMEKLHNTCCQSKFYMLDSFEQKEFSKQNKDTDCFDACTKVNLLLLRFILICCFV